MAKAKTEVTAFPFHPYPKGVLAIKKLQLSNGCIFPGLLNTTKSTATFFHIGFCYHILWHLSLQEITICWLARLRGQQAAQVNFKLFQICSAISLVLFYGGFWKFINPELCLLFLLVDMKNICLMTFTCRKQKIYQQSRKKCHFYKYFSILFRTKISFWKQRQNVYLMPAINIVSAFVYSITKWICCCSFS